MPALGRYYTQAEACAAFWDLIAEVQVRSSKIARSRGIFVGPADCWLIFLIVKRELEQALHVGRHERRRTRRIASEVTA